MKTVNVVAAIIKRRQKILATQRGYGEFAGGWEFPGGKIEAGETPKKAIIREIKEELGVDVKPEAHLVTVDYDYPSFHLHMACYVCSMLQEEISLLEHQDAKWLDLSNIDSVEWLPADIAVVDAIKAANLIG